MSDPHFLLRIEWIYNEVGSRMCPICREQQKYGHAEGCELDQLIKQLTVPVEPFPKEVGLYWFYGWVGPVDKTKKPAAWTLVKVYEVSQGKFAYVGDDVWYPTFGPYDGTWYKTVMPHL